ncbi:MAG TPA: hypothetical protein VFX15_08700 [Actinomycetes bacterium]|nr:hypothetical protein [Actinomycetes bacterium]
MRLVLLPLFLTACSPDSEPIDCDIAEVDGVYYFDWEQVDGNCDINDGLMPFSLAEITPGCTVDRDVDGCRVTEVQACEGDVHVVIVVDQLDDDGDSISGKMTVSDPAECSGTLRFEAERQ